MGQYISKAAVVAELERLYNLEYDNASNLSCGKKIMLRNILLFLDTLEVKDEVASTDPIKAMQEALRMEYEKGRADVLRCIDPDEMVADFCSQPLSKTRSLASIYRQGIIDIVKRINNNEKTSITSTRSINDCGM